MCALVIGRLVDAVFILIGMRADFLHSPRSALFCCGAATRCAILKLSVQKPCRAHPYHCRTSVPTGALASVWRWGVVDGGEFPLFHGTAVHAGGGPQRPPHRPRQG